MACHAAMIDKALTIKADTTVEKAVKAMKKAKAEYAPVLDADGTVAGLFSFEILMKNLLPVQVAMNDGTQLDIQLPAAPGIAKRLKNVQLIPVEQLMQRADFPVVYPETPTWEGVKAMVQTNLPLIVEDQQSQK